MTWAAAVVCALMMKYHWAGFDASLLCYYIQLDIGSETNKEFEDGIRFWLKHPDERKQEEMR